MASQPSGGLAPVVAVVPLALQHHDAPTVGSAHHLHGRSRHGRAGPGDEHVDGLRSLGVDGPHLRRGHDRYESLGDRQLDEVEATLGAVDVDPLVPGSRTTLGDDHRFGHQVAVGQRHVDPADPHLPRPLRGRSPQEDRRATGLAAQHLDVVPADGADAHAEGLQRGLLGREPRRIALDGILAQLGVDPLPRREEAIDDRGLPRQHRPEAFEVDDVDTDAEDHDAEPRITVLAGERRTLIPRLTIASDPPGR